ncbi:ABC transporter domain-containing protein [Ditylenchus destructor]|uniref:ABC transporter domain-containing protein n=1 Tax=Ditylenchus destructor TaxID=166010 RepID=A0AAD4MGR0_9BILA|nr:ABC transporter domain-containing protein [Ditylenchus destructor]
MSATAFLDVRDISVVFGGLKAVNGLSFQVEQGRIHALIGPNGAGKSTTFNCISRFYTPSSGSVSFEGRELTRNLELFAELSVLENVLLGTHARAAGTLGRLLRRPDRETEDYALHLLERVGLVDERDQPARDLDFGRQKLLELARALAIRPRLLLLDEPAAGLRNREIESLDRLLKELVARDGITVLLVEHVMQLVMSISDRITVMAFGEKIAEGTPSEIGSNARALCDVSVEVPEGQIVALLGSNGAGKTTTLNCISNIVDCTEGEVRLAGERIDRLGSDALVKRGIVQVPEGRQVFRDMSVRENLDLGAYLRRDRTGIRNDLEAVYAMFPRLKERQGQMAATLSGGEQQMLAIGRAVMARPRVMLFDEPSMGLSPLLVEQMFGIIEQLHRDQKITILLVEQNVQLALAVSSYGYILENGEISLHGPAAQLANDEAVRRAYLGV